MAQTFGAEKPLAQGVAASRLQLTFGISVLFALLNLGGGFINAFLPLHFEGLSFSPVQIAACMALLSLVRIVASPLLCGISDRAGRRRHSIALFSVLFAAILLVLSGVSGFWLVFSLMFVGAVFMAPVEPLLDAYSYEAAYLKGVAYGTVRSAGSSAYVVATACGGLLLSFISTQMLIVVIAATCVGCAISAMTLPSMPTEHKRDGDAPSLWSTPELRNGDLHKLMLAAGLVLGGFGAFNSFSSIYWVGKGIDLSFIGLLWAMGTVAEIFVFMNGTKVLERVGARNMMLIGALAGAVRWIAFPFAESVAAIIALQMLHALNFGMLYLGFKTLVAQMVSRELLGTAQGLSMTYVGCVLGVSGLASGWLYSLAPSLAFFAMAVLCAAGFVLMLTFKPKSIQL